MARDPLAGVNAFFIRYRVILAGVLGIRMCPLCPHCTNNPCQDALGSVAELLGGCAGRADALVGAVERLNAKYQMAACIYIFYSSNDYISLALYKK